MNGKDISTEAWREYDFVDEAGNPRTYRIDAPKTLYVGTTTHRVVDAVGVTHCCPAPGHHACVVRWCADPPVSF